MTRQVDSSNDSYPLVSVIFLSYKRPHLLKKTFEAFVENTNYPRERLELILCDDGSPEDIQSEIRKIPFDKYLLSKKNNGLGANTNQGIQNANGEYILQLQDDWALSGNHNYLQIGIKTLEYFEDIALIRYRLGRDFYFSEMRPIGTTSEKIKVLSRKISGELFLYSDNPHLKRSSFHQIIGLYKEGVKMELTELDMCKKFLDKTDWNAAVIDGYENVFLHIGEQESHRKSSPVKEHIYGTMMSHRYLVHILSAYRWIKKLLF